MHQRVEGLALRRLLTIAAAFVAVEAKQRAASTSSNISAEAEVVGTLLKRARAHASNLRADVSVADATSGSNNARFIPLKTKEETVVPDAEVAVPEHDPVPVTPRPEPVVKPRWRWRKRALDHASQLANAGGMHGGHGGVATPAPTVGDNLLDGLEAELMTTPPPGTTPPPEKYEFNIELMDNNAHPDPEPGRVKFKDFAPVWFGYLVVATVFAALVYKSRSIEPRGRPPDPERTMEHGHFECFQDRELLFNSCCCPWVRWADTMSKTGLVTHSAWVEQISKEPKFWTAFAIFACFGLFTYYSMICIGCLLFFFRLKLRHRLGLHGDGAHTCCADLWYSCCCPCCLISQEARVMSEAIQVGRLKVENAPAQIVGPGWIKQEAKEAVREGEKVAHKMEHDVKHMLEHGHHKSSHGQQGSA